MVMEFTSYRSFLKATLAERTSRNPSLSMRAFARHLGISPATLTQLFKGRRNLSPDRALRIAGKLGLSEQETEYFTLLVQYEGARSPARRSILLGKIRALRPREKVHDLDVDRFKLISEWYHLPILEMTLLHDFKLTASNAAKLLGISKAEAELALDRLERVGALRRTASGKYKRVHNQLLTFTDLPVEGLRRHHHQLLKKAIASIETQSPQEKFIGSFHLAFDPDQLGEAKELLREFFMKLSELAEKGKHRSKIYHLSTAFFDLTHQER